MLGEKTRMPVVFVGHGSPMNAIEENKFTKGWRKMAESIPKPQAILAVSAHWYTEGTRINDSGQPEMVYDMYGFPEELYQVRYPAKGTPKLAQFTKELISKEVLVDNSWGCDHGTWSVLCKMYPQADIPLYQLSVDRNAGAAVHFKIGQELRTLRDKGVMIFASGNVVHNLSRVDFSMKGGYLWAMEFDAHIKERILKGEYEEVINYRSLGNEAALAVPTPDHFYPLLYALGAAEPDERVTVYNDDCTLGALSMTSYVFSS